MSQFNRFGGPRTNVLKETANGTSYVDWKDVESHPRMLSPNRKIYSRKRLGTTAAEQRKVAQAIKRARHMGLLPFTSATL
ncbi:MAG: 30S ribosomal protein S18 [Phycisphaerales bacterium JB050]